MAGLCASIEIRSLRGGALTRSFHRRVKYSSIFSTSAWRASSVLNMPPSSGKVVITSDHQVSSLRSSSGKSNSVASISVVSSIETFSTQLKFWLRGRLSSTLAVRSRISDPMPARLPGATMGLTALRCSSCSGGSAAMNDLPRLAIGRSINEIPPSMTSDE